MPANRKPLLPVDAAAFIHGEEPGKAGPTPAPAAAVSHSEPEAKVRFTVDLPRSLHRKLKQEALDRDQPMTELARDVLRAWLENL
jgi:hypothetical protein